MQISPIHLFLLLFCLLIHYVNPLKILYSLCVVHFQQHFMIVHWNTLANWISFKTVKDSKRSVNIHCCSDLIIISPLASHLMYRYLRDSLTTCTCLLTQHRLEVQVKPIDSLIRCPHFVRLSEKLTRFPLARCLLVCFSLSWLLCLWIKSYSV